MGADLLLTWCEYPKGYTDPPPGHDPDEVLAQRAAALTIDQLIEVAEQVFGLLNPCDQDEFTVAIADTRTAIHEGLEILAGGGDRETVMLDDRIITGGMSWGDTPTESFPAIEALTTSRICEEPMPWWSPWRDDQTQFARLIAECEATGVFAHAMERGGPWRDLLEAMDLDSGDVDELIARAQAAWDTTKAGLT